MTTAASQIERAFRRRSSFIQEQRREKRDPFEQLDEVEVDVVDVKPKPRSSRYKSASVCVAMISMKPERVDADLEFPRPTVHRCGGASRFVVERSCQQDSLDPMELQSIRLRGLSTSEVFHEPPKMYVYTERPPQQYPIRKVSQPATIAAFVKKRKHTLCAWAFGIVAISLITTIIVLQMSGSLG